MVTDQMFYVLFYHIMNHDRRLLISKVLHGYLYGVGPTIIITTTSSTNWYILLYVFRCNNKERVTCIVSL